MPAEPQNPNDWQDESQQKALEDTAAWLSHQAQCYKEHEVPQWDASSTFEFDDNKRSWLSRLGLTGFQVSPNLSMAMSVAAIFMVLFNVQLQFNEQGMLLSFATSEQQQTDKLRSQLKAEFEQKLVAFSRDQQLVIASHFDDIQDKQREDVTQLASYLISASRQERKEDIGALVNYIKEQRNVDMSLNQQQLNEVLYRVSQQSSNMSFNEAKFRRASLTTEPAEPSIKSLKDESNLTLSNEEGK